MTAFASGFGRFVRPHASCQRGQRRIIPLAACLVAAAVVPRPATAGLVLWWQFSGSGTAVNGVTTLADSSASGYAGTFSSSGTASAVFETVTYGTSGVTGTGLNFSAQSANNGSQVGAFGSLPNLSFGTGNFSISLWVRKEAATNGSWSNTSAVRVGSGTTTLDFYVGSSNGGASDKPTTLWGSGNITSGTNQNVNLSTASLPVDPSATAALSHIVSVRSGNTNTLYVNGVSAGTLTNWPVGGSVNADGVFAVNWNPGGAMYQTNATFSNLQVYDEALTGAQVASLYANPLVVVPEPGALALAAIGIGAAAGVIRGRRARGDGRSSRRR